MKFSKPNLFERFIETDTQVLNYFTKREEILFIEHMRICVIVTEINVCSNGNPLHYYALRVPCKADKWQ